MAATCVTLTGCSSSEAEAATWPSVKSPIELDASIESKIDDWLEKMSLEQKVGQMIQAEIKSISPDDAAKYHIGSILNGGGSWPTDKADGPLGACLLYTSPSPRDATLSRMPSSA